MHANAWLASLATWELPGVDGVDVDDGDDAVDVAAEVVQLVAEVEGYQLLLRRVEAVPWGQAAARHANRWAVGARPDQAKPAASYSHYLHRRPPPLGLEELTAELIEDRLGCACAAGSKECI